MNENPLSAFPDPLPIEETIITAAIVEIESPTAETAETEGLCPPDQESPVTIAQLQKALFEMQERVDTKTRRLRSYDTILAQQTEELKRERQQLQRSIAEVERYRQEEQRHQRSLVTLSEELAITQQQLARLERECTLIQENHHEKTQKLISAERQISELHSRLQRQQRYTLQYKAALDQCLGETIGQKPSTDLAIVPPVSSIEPWSSQEAIDVELALTRIADNGIEKDNIDEFLAEFENIEPLEEPKHQKLDWPSPIISSLSSSTKYPAIRIDLPAFLKNRLDQP
jgi:DNA repair exonuclease SbcCD ATPase subunit